MRRSLLIALGIACVFVAGSAWGAFEFLKSDLPNLEHLVDYQPPQASKVYSADGFLVGYFANERRTVVDVQKLPKHVKYAFLAAEDADFYKHQGIDYVGILRAALKNLRPGAHLQGASTITQQTVKALVLGPERSYLRKIKEALLARQIEKTLTKDEILHIYLNQIYFGDGAWGIEEAAQTHFAKPAAHLTLGEAALLASIPKNPKKYTIDADLSAAKSRQRYVLHQMQLHRWATAQDVSSALSEPISMKHVRNPYYGHASYYLEHVRRLLLEKYGEKRLYEGGLSIYLAMYARYQQAAHAAVQKGLEDVAKRQGFTGPRFRLSSENIQRLLPLAEKRLRNYTDVMKQPSDRGMMLFDLNALKRESLTHIDHIESSIKIQSYEPYLRIVSFVSAIDSKTQDVFLPLGSAYARLAFKNIAWARKWPHEHTLPKKSSDILHVGDVVAIDLTGLSTRVKSYQQLPVFDAELVPQPIAQAALIAIDPKTRHVQALIGGYAEEAVGLNRATQSLRQPGSAFKPILYAAALDSKLFTPATLCQDAPIAIEDTKTGKVWRPDNYNVGQYAGFLTYREALTRSLNTCSVRMIEKVGVQPVIALARAMGITSKMPENMTLALGSGDVVPLDLANAYTTIASMGYFSEPIFITMISDSVGNVLEKNIAQPQAVLKPSVAYVLTSMMQSVIQHGTAMRAQVLERVLAGKTGTSNESRNTWFSGFAPQLVSTVWVGMDDNTPLDREAGSSTALPIWIRFMGSALHGLPVQDFIMPEGVVTVPIDPQTGALSTQANAVKEYFLEGTEPHENTEVLPSLFTEDTLQ